MLGDIKRDMQKERPYMLEASSTSRAEPSAAPATGAGLLGTIAPQAPAAPAPSGMSAPAPGPAPAGVPGGAGAPQAPGAGPEPNASPEEQEQYDRLMAQFMQYIHGAGAEDVVARLQAGRNNVPAAIGEIVAEMGRAFSTSAGQAGETLDDGVMMHAATEAVEQLSEVAEAGGVAEVSDEDMESALYEALSKYGNGLIQSGGQSADDNAAIAQGLDYLDAQGAGAGEQGVPGAGP